MRIVKDIFFFVGVCIVLVNGMSDEMKDLLDNLHAQCITDVGASEDVIAKAQKGEFQDDEKLKCYMKCLFDEMGLLDDDGKIDIEGMISILPDEIREPFAPTLRKCGAKASGEPCQLSFMIYKCCFEEAPQICGRIEIFGGKSNK